MDSICDVCGQSASLLCSVCHDAVYCSKECQQNDYVNGHNTICTDIADLNEQALNEEITYFIEEPLHEEIAHLAHQFLNDLSITREQKELFLKDALHLEHFHPEEVEFIEALTPEAQLRKGKALRFKSKVTRGRSAAAKGRAMITRDKEKREKLKTRGKELKEQAEKERKRARRLKRKARRRKRKKRK